ncbi:MAG: HAMP domain-containing histidine kinase, partial [Ruminococcus sp.]|nr:HAMP domain-containing histidine kinase [Ruminococcus sp.]
MRAFNRIFAASILIIIAVFTVANVILLTDNNESGRPYKVEISRLVHDMENGESTDLTDCEYVTGIEKCSENFYDSDSDYVICEVNGELYRFDYNASGTTDKTRQIIIVNIILSAMTFLIIAILLYVRMKILRPFEKLSDVPYELSKGNLTVPVKETRSRFFGRFIWGVDMLRENMEQQKERELDLQKDKKTLLLSLSHDIKTPLS